MAKISPPILLRRQNAGAKEQGPCHTPASLIPRVIEWAQAASARLSFYVEARLAATRVFEISWRQENLEDTSIARQSHAVVRVLDAGGREGISQTDYLGNSGDTFVSPEFPRIDSIIESLERLLEQAQAGLKASAPDPFRVPPLTADRRGKPKDSQNLNLLDASIQSPSRRHQCSQWMRDLQSRLRRKERVRPLRCELDFTIEETALATSQGFHWSEQSSLAQASLTLAVEKNGSVEVAGCGLESRTLAGLKKRLPSLAEKTAWQARHLTDARSLPSGRYPVVLDAIVAAEMLEVLASTFCADQVQKGLSPWKGRLASQVASPLVTLADDARIPEGVGSSLWDEEGFPTGSRRVVEAGILTGLLYDTYTARVDGTVSTANAGRNSRGSIAPEVWNFYLKPGKKSLKHLLRDTGSGLYLTELMGLHTVDVATGEFSLSGSGFHIRNGEIGRPAHPLTVSGNLYELLKRVDGVADDLEFYSAVASPSFRVEYLDIGGTR